MDFVPDDWPLCEFARCSGIPAEGFRRCLEHLNTGEFDQFLARLGPGSDLDVRGTTIDSPLLRKLLQAFGKSGVPVFGDVRFDHAHIEGADFDHVCFGGRAQFNHARFSGDASFAEARFDGLAGFDHARFENSGYFNNTVFSGGVWFGSSVFREDANFRGAVFETASRLVFGSAEVLRLKRARFARPVDLWVIASSVWCDETRFESGVTMSLGGHWTITAERTVFGGPSTISGGGCRLLSLRGTDVSNLSLTDVDLSQCAFAGAHRLDQLRIEGKCSFAVSSGGRRVIAEEAGWRNRPDPELQPAHLVRERRWATADQAASDLAVLYRSLRKSLEDSKNEAGAGDFYYGEMEMRRHSSETRLAERVILWLYWALSGYGQRAGRALIALLVLVTTVAVLLAMWGQPPAEAAQIAVGAVVLRDPGAELTEAGQWTVMVARFLGPVLLALAVLAVRARVKR